ncbi:MAG: GTP-binding protein [Pyrinomonadaceae bacterium]
MDRGTLKLVLVGGVDHGKSTLLGRLLDESRRRGGLAAGGESDGRAGSDYALYADSLAEEREGLYTLDTTQAMIEAGGRLIVLIDVPGHAELIKNMVTGASQAEAALVVVDASQGLCLMAERHLEVLRLLEIDRCVVCVNKIETVGYDAAEFGRLALSLKATLSSYGLRPDGIIPLSALTGENVVRPSERLSWYQGPTLWEALSSLPWAAESAGERPRFMLQDRYLIDDAPVYVGRVESGEISRGQRLALYPGGRPCTVSSIEKFGAPSPERAAEGDCIGVTLECGESPRAGQILSPAEDPPLVSDSLRVMLMNLAAEPLEAGARLRFQCSSLEALCSVARVERRGPAGAGATPGRLPFSEIGEAILSFDEPVAVERFRDVPSLGRFVLFTATKVVAGGVIQGGAGESEGRS